MSTDLMQIIIASIILYVIPVILCYMYKITGIDKLVPVYNILLILEHLRPADYQSTQQIFDSLYEEIDKLKDSEYIAQVERENRRKQYVFDFIKQQKLEQSFDEYCDSREVMQILQQQETK